MSCRETFEGFVFKLRSILTKRRQGHGKKPNLRLVNFHKNEQTNYVVEFIKLRRFFLHKYM